MIGIGKSQIFKVLYYYEEEEGFVEHDEHDIPMTLYVSLIGRTFDYNKPAILIVPVAGEIYSINIQPKYSDRFSGFVNTQSFENFDTKFNPSLKWFINKYDKEDPFFVTHCNTYSDLYKECKDVLKDSIEINNNYDHNIDNILKLVSSKYMNVNSFTPTSYVIIVLNNYETIRTNAIIVSYVIRSVDHVLDLPMISNAVGNFYGFKTYPSKVNRNFYLFVKSPSTLNITMKSLQGLYHNSDYCFDNTIKHLHIPKESFVTYHTIKEDE